MRRLIGHGNQRPARFYSRGTAWAVLLLAAAAPLTAQAASVKPQRIVSLNLCADQLVLSLVKPRRVLAVSRLAANPTYSNLAERARGLPIHHKRAEEIVVLRPDLVVSGRSREGQISHLLRRLGFSVLEVDAPESIQGVREQIRAMAAALGETERGEMLIADMDAKLEALAETPRRPLRAVVYRPNGYTSGRRTLVHEIMTHAGLSNVAPDLGIERWGTITLETLIHRRPPIVILDDDLEQKSSVAQRALLHPAFGHIAADTSLVSIPPRLWICPGPWMADAASALVSATAEARDASR